MKNEYALNLLNQIEQLPENWNENGAKHFSSILIEKCKNYLFLLEKEPFVSPTACGTIQFEYDKENGDYLEFEISETKVLGYICTMQNGEHSFEIKDEDAIDKINEMVVKFFNECSGNRRLSWQLFKI